MMDQPQVQNWIFEALGAEDGNALGVDLVSLARVEESWQERGSAWLERVLTEAEREHLERFGSGRKVEWIAGRLAAKEAVFKALARESECGMRWQEIQVLTRSTGAPDLQLRGKMHEQWMKQGAPQLVLSLSHDGGWAFACCLMKPKDRVKTGGSTSSEEENISLPFIIQNNSGRHLATTLREICPAFLSPTGIRYMAARSRCMSVVCIPVRDGRVQALSSYLQLMRQEAMKQDLGCPDDARLEGLIRKLQGVEFRKHALLRLVLTSEAAWVHYAHEQAGEV